MQRRAIITSEQTEALVQAGQDWNFHEESTQEHLHTLHPYPAKFIPQIPRRALTLWSRKGDLVYDPFCGCGTTLLEAKLLGRPSVGTDNNAVAVLVSRAKTASYRPSHIAKLRAFGDNLEKGMASIPRRERFVPDAQNLSYWFHPNVLKDLAALKVMILATNAPLQSLLLSCFSAIIVKVSYQDSDTRYTRVERAIEPNLVLRAFRAKLRSVCESLIRIPASTTKVVVHHSDARAVPQIADGSVSLIITSPPYLNAYDYHKYHRQRLHWIDGDVPFARDIEIGSHDKFTKPRATPDQYFCDMDLCLGEWARVLKKNGRCVVLIGDAIVSKQEVPVADMLVSLARNHGLSLTTRWIRTLMPTKRAFNVKNSRMSHEHVLLFSRHQSRESK